MQEFILIEVQEGCLVTGPAGSAIQVESEARHPTIEGVQVNQAQTFINERRVLVVSYNSQEPPGTLGYTVVVRPGCSVGDHYHHRRDERLLVLHGKAQFRLLDERPDSPAHGLVNVFTLDYPGSSVHVPTGVAHASRPCPAAPQTSQPPSPTRRA